MKVLIVDDEQPARERLRQILNDEDGYDVIGEAGNGEEAIAMAARLQPDVVLLDVEMPVMDGVAALPEPQQVAPEAGIILVSSPTTNGADVTLPALQPRPSHFVTKPQVRACEDGLAALRPPL